MKLGSNGRRAPATALGTGALIALCWACASQPLCRSGATDCRGGDPASETGNGGSAGEGADPDPGTTGATGPGTEGGAGGTGARSAVAKFCSEVNVDGEQATLRLTMGDHVFEASDGICSECQTLPAGESLTAELTLIPQGISLSTFYLEFPPGEYVILATVRGGEPGLLTAPGLPGARCESLDPFAPAPAAAGPADIKFCQDFRLDGEDTNLRLSVNGEAFDAATGTCSPCRELPENVPLDFEVRLMPDDVVGSVFTDTLDPGPGVLMVEPDGEIIYYPGRFYQKCEDLDPF